MSNAGTNLQTLLRETERVFGQVALLLRTSEELMEAEGWLNAANDGGAFAYQSTHVNNPNYWMPVEVFRFFKHPTATTALAYVSVILRDPKNEYPHFTEPLITAGWFEYGQLPKLNSQMYWHCRWHAYRPQRVDDGRWYTTTTSELPPNEVKTAGYKFSKARTFGLPLVEISNPEKLKTKVIGPLEEELHPLTRPPTFVG